jgi:hypothetical protein
MDVIVHCNCKETAWSRVLLEKIIVAQLIKKFPAFCGSEVLCRVYKNLPPIPSLTA